MARFLHITVPEHACVMGLGMPRAIVLSGQGQGRCWLWPYTHPDSGLALAASAVPAAADMTTARIWGAHAVDA